MDFRIDPSQLPPVDKSQTSKYAPRKEKTDEKDQLVDSFARSKPTQPDIYTSGGRILGVEDKDGSLLDHFRSFKESVESQLNALFQSYVSNSEDTGLAEQAKEGLSVYFAENPDALAEVESGNVPEYWNVENTAKRMFSIVTMGFGEGTEVNSFYDKAVSFVNQAYDEVHDMLGFDFPPLVLDTKEALLNGLEQLKEGEPLDKIVFV